MARQGLSFKKIHTFLENYFNFVIIGLILILLLSSYFLLINPKINQIVSSIQNDVNNQQTILVSQRTRLETIQNSLNLYRSIEAADLDRIQLVLPDYYPSEKLFGDIEDVVLQNGIMLSSLSITDNVETSAQPTTADVNFNSSSGNVAPSNIGTIKLTMSLSAIDYITMKRFLPILETQLPPLKIETLGFSSGGENLALTATTYYFKP